MRRLVVTFALFILLGVVLALVFRDHQGYVLVSFNGWRIETSLLFACAALIVGLWVLITLWRLLVAGILMPSAVRRRLADRRARKARRSLYTGLLRLAEGRWSAAETELRRLAEENEAPGLNYLHAARAAQGQGEVARRDEHLKSAAGRKGASELAVLMTRADLQIRQGQFSDALDSLAQLYRMDHRNPAILENYAEQCMAAGDYERLRTLLPELRKHGHMPASRVDALAVAAWRDELAHNDNHADILTSAWRRVPKQLRSDPRLVICYARAMARVGGDDDAAEVIRSVLEQKWDPALVLVFGELKTNDQTSQLSTVESWLRQYGEKPELLLVAGRLCLRNRLWGRARSYFEASQDNQSRPEALLELGRLFEEINEKDEARDAYRQGLEIRTAAR